MAQQKIVRSDSMKICAASSICFREMPDCSTISSHEASLTAAANSSNPLVVTLNELVVEYFPGRCVCAQHRLCHSFEQRHVTIDPHLQKQIGERGAIAKPTDNSCGCLKRVMPTSGSGLMCTNLQPFCFACCSAVNMRGWFVPGFCPMTKIAWARSKSSSVTVPLPTPIVSLSAEPLDS